MIRPGANKPFSTLYTPLHRSNGNSPVQLLGRYHRWIIYGGATLVTVAVLLAAVIAMALYAENFIHAQRLLFDAEQRQVEIKVLSANSKMRQTIVRQQFLRVHRGTDMAPQSTTTLAARHPRTHRHDTVGHKNLEKSIENATVNASVNAAINAINDPDTISTESYVTTILDATSRPSALEALLTQFYDVVPSAVMNTSPAEQGTTIMLYDKNLTFLGMHMPQAEKPHLLQKKNRAATRAAIAKAVAPIEHALQSIPLEQLRAGKTVWLAPYVDALTDTLMLSRAAVVFHGKQPFSVLVISVPAEQFSQHFLSQPLSHGFAVITAAGRVLSGKLINHISTAAVLHHQDREETSKTYTSSLNSLFSGDATLIALSHPIGATGWTMVYTFDWAMLWEALHSEILFAMAVALTLCTILWTIVILFNRLIFIPVMREALRVHDSEAFSRAMMGVAPLGFFVLSYPTGALMLDNEQARAVGNQDYNSPDLASFHQRLMACYKNLGAAIEADQTLAHAVLELCGEDGDYTYALAAFTRTRYLHNDVLLCCLSDITVQKRAERTLVQAKTDADEANKAKSMFLALISHEIRTPLHGAAGHLELLEMATLPDAEHELVQTIRGSFDSLLRIINDILDISRIEAGQLALNNAPFNLHEVVTCCTHLWTPALDAKSVAFICRTAPNVPTYLLGDAGRIKQILNNLLSNAVKFTHQGSIVLDISGSPKNGGYVLQIGIRDSGIGISQHDQKRLFTPFSQANASIAGEFGGTGLGLSLCKQLIDAMHGRINIESTYGSGTIVMVTLLLCHTETDRITPAIKRAIRDTSPTKARPLTDLISNVSPVSAPFQQLHSLTDWLAAANRLRVLVVEDDLVSSKLMEKQLLALGCIHVDFVNNGMEALERATSRQGDFAYDLILTDMSLPQMSGQELVLSLRQIGLSTPIIVISASVSNSQTTAILPEIDAFLIKPVSLNKLKAALAPYVLAATTHDQKLMPALYLSPDAAAESTFDTTGARRWPVVDADIAIIFLDTYRDDLRSLLQAYQVEDVAILSARLHRLKGALLVIQEDALAQHVERLCHAIFSNGCNPNREDLRLFVKGLLFVVRHLRVALLADPGVTKPIT
ncbi:ATP-binding protein [Glaciimonas immobilis]|uniref:Virulence sensor protein BvgS n=1 Tax=Glaciimonas immobilis TaxID=728004 RepID=A0A840RZU5_9BURK|nr:ATP-binding protein [Glaciimonas immobilis]KAF3998313.1 response regulator [Glaciimonas immobilis]MBB5201930.1 signal transduction histidine kinase/CheY-like chemotaxis protein [Glaciimonas immobilis]